MEITKGENMSQVQPSQHKTDDPEVQAEAQPQSQPPQQSPSSRNILKTLKPLLLVSLGVVIGLLLGIILTANLVRQSTPTKKLQIQPPSAHATQSLASGRIGQATVIGLWQVTFNRATTSPGDHTFAPHAGKIFLIVDVTVQNDSSDPQIISSGLMFILKDSTGQAYNETLTDIGKPLDGTVQAGDKLRGQMIYEVPATEHSFTFQFQDSTYYANVGTWNIRV